LIKIVFFNALLLAALLAAFELFLRKSAGPPTPKNEMVFTEDCYWHEEPKLAYSYKPNCYTVSKRIFDGKEIYSAEYFYDEFGRRKSPSRSTAHSTKKQAFIALLGDSNIFGEGLAFDDTIQGTLKKNLERFRVYNYAISGHGLNHQLAHADLGQIKTQVLEDDGFFFTFYIKHMAERLLANVNYLRSHGVEYHPAWVLQSNGRFEFKGKIGEVFPNRIWLARKFIDRFGLAKAIWDRMNFDYPAPEAPSSQKQICQAYLQIQQGLREQKPKSKLVLILSRPSIVSPAYFSCLKGKIPVVDFRDHPDFKAGGHDDVIAHGIDHHFSAKYATALGNQITGWVRSTQSNATNQ